MTAKKIGNMSAIYLAPPKKEHFGNRDKFQIKDMNFRITYRKLA